MKPCAKVMNVTAGEATKLTANGKPVMLESMKGTTDGTISTTPQALVTASAEQSILTAR
jgi:hypothetical protein